MAGPWPVVKMGEVSVIAFVSIGTVKYKKFSKKRFGGGPNETNYL
jgi:hypothetical protein